MIIIVLKTEENYTLFLSHSPEFYLYYIIKIKCQLLFGLFTYFLFSIFPLHISISDTFFYPIPFLFVFRLVKKYYEYVILFLSLNLIWRN